MCNRLSKLRIAGYLRISVDTEKDQDSTSIENQRDIITRYVKDKFNDYELDFYTDRDRSGYTFEQREDYQRLRPLLMNGDYKILIVKDFSRFSRRNSKGLGELEDLRDAGVRIISITDNIDFPTYDEWHNIQIRFLFNEMPVTDASKKVKNVIDSRQKKGEWVCSVPYGYYITNTKTMTYIVDEQAVPVIREIFDLYLDGWGYKKIANYLTEKKIPTPRMVDKQRRDEERAKMGEKPTKIRASNIWAIPSVKGILVNDFYIGTLREKKYTRAKINGKDIKLDESEHQIFENHHEPIIDARTFAKVQEQLKLRTTTNYRGVKKYDSAYSGFLFCGDCGSPMFSMSRPNLAPAYTCGAYHKHGTHKDIGGCSSHHTRVDLLDTMLKTYIKRVMMNSKQMIDELEKGIKQEPKTVKDDTSSLEALEVELARAKEDLKNNTRRRDREIERAENRFSADILDKEIDRIYETYDKIEDELRDRIDSLEGQVRFLTEKRNNTIQINRIAKTAMDIFHDILEKEKLDKGDLSLIVDKIIVYEDNIEIQLKADIAMLLETGNVSKELLENSSFIGNTVNFNWDTKSILNANVVQKANQRKDKAFSVNVICEGDPLEIYTSNDGEVVFKKYSPIGELSQYAAQYTQVLNKFGGLPAVVCDRDHIVAVSGVPKKDLLDKRVSPEFEDAMNRRKLINVTHNDDSRIKLVEGNERYVLSSAPILASGDVCGAVMFLSSDQHNKADEMQKKLIEMSAGVLGKQLEE